MKLNQYRITVESIDSTDDSVAQTLQFNVEDHENLFGAIEKIKQGSDLAPEAATQFAVGLRLFGTTLLKHPKHPLFADLMPHFKAFMTNLKKTIKAAK